MPYINETYKFVYKAKNFTSGLTDVKLFVYKPDMTKLGEYILTEIDTGDGKGIYYYDFNGADSPGVYTFVCDSLTQPLRDARSLYFDSRQLIADTILNSIVEGSFDVQDSLKLMLSVLVAKSSGGGTDIVKFRDTNDSVDRITANVDENGNRLNVTIIA